MWQASTSNEQTVLCLAVHGGAVELGPTDSFDQDIQLVHFVRDAFDDRDKRMISPPVNSLWSNPYLNYDVAVSSLPTSESSSPGNGSITTLNNSNQSSLQSINYMSHANHKVGGFGFESLMSSPSPGSGIIHPGDVMNSCLEQHQPNSIRLSQHSAAAGSWTVSLEEQQARIRHYQDQPSSMRQSANLKHKFSSSPSGGVLAKPSGGSCMASLEQALFRPQVRHVSIPQRGPVLPPVESKGKLLSEFRAQLFNQQLQQNHNLLMQSPGSETVISTSSPQISAAAALIDTLNSSSSSDVHWRGSSSPRSSRRYLHVESVKGLAAAEVSLVPDDASNKKLACCPSEEDSESHGHNIITSTSYDHFSGFLLPPEPLSLPEHHHRQLAAPPGRTHSNTHSWSSEVSPTVTTSDKEQEAEGGFSLWEDSDKVLENRRFMEWSRKRARGVSETSNIRQADNQTDVADKLNRHGIPVERNHFLEEENKKYQLLRAMVQNKLSTKSDKASVLDDIIELVEELQRRVKESESTTASSASDDCQKPNHLGRSPSFTTTLMQGVNHVNLKPDYNHHVLQHQYGGEKGGNGGPNNASLLTLSDVCLDNEDGLDGVVLGVLDDIPQIEVRMMENDQVMIKLSCKDRPGLFTDIMFALQDLQLQVQHANIRTVAGAVHDVFAAKVDVSLAEKQRTSDIAEAIRRAIEKGNIPNSFSPNPATPDASPNISSPLERSA